MWDPCKPESTYSAAQVHKISRKKEDVNRGADVAKRRMFSLDIVDTDKFMDMPSSAQNLYFHLGMRADDDGFVSSPRKITSMVGCGADDLKILASKGFVIPFESGICVVTDWNKNNYIQKDRYTETQYIEEKARLSVNKNGAYCIQDVYMLDTQVRLGKDSIGKDSTREGAPAPTSENKKPVKHKRGKYGWVKLSDDEYTKLKTEYGAQVAHHFIAYVDESAQGTGNKNKWKDWNLVVRKAIRQQWGGAFIETEPEKHFVKTGEDDAGMPIGRWEEKV